MIQNHLTLFGKFAFVHSAFIYLIVIFWEGKKGMGNGLLSSFSQDGARLDPSISAILGPSTKNLTSLLTMDEELRGIFAIFVVSGKWMETFLPQYCYRYAESNFVKCFANGDKFSNANNNNVNNVIEHLCYILPTGELLPTLFHVAKAKDMNAIAAAEQAQLTFARQMSRRHLDKEISIPKPIVSPENMQHMICAALMSMFVRSQEFEQWYRSNLEHLVMNDHLQAVLHQANISNSTQSSRSNNKSLVNKSMDAVISTVKSMKFSSSKKWLELDLSIENLDSDDSMSESANHEIEGTLLFRRDKVELKLETNRSDRTASISNVNSPINCSFPISNNSTEAATTETHQISGETNRPETYCESLLVHTMANMEVFSLSQTLSSDLWLRQGVRHCLETLPIAITIADARCRPNETFPLVYVNHSFEKLTGYHRQEVIGRNCRFLQSEERTEMQQVERMIVALREGQPLKLAVTNQRKDGSTFLNFLALRPVFNRENQYSYVVGISYDIAQAKAGSSGFYSQCQKKNAAAYFNMNRWESCPQDEHDRLIEDLEGIDALVRIIPMLLVD